MLRTFNSSSSAISSMKKSIFRFGKPYIWAFILAYVVYGCYYFVSHDTPPEWQGDPTAQDQAAVAAAGGPGAAVYNAKCAVCHQMDGQGLPGVYPTLVGSDFATGDPAIPVRIVLNGFQGPIERNGQKFNGVMQPWRNDLTDQEIADVLNFVRTTWGNSAPEIDPATVAEIREATKGKAGAWTEDQLKAAM